MWHIDAEIICFIFMLVLMFDIIKTNAASSLRGKLFNALAVATLLSILSDIISSYAMVNYRTCTWWVIQGSLLVYFLLTPFLSTLWQLYAITVVQTESAKRHNNLILTAVPFFCYAALTLSNPYTGWMFELSAEKVYQRGILFNSMYILFYGYSLGTLILAFVNFRKMERATSIVLVVFPLIAGFGIFLQQILPGYLITGAAFTLVILITYMFLQNRNATRDNMTGLFNRAAFSGVIDRIVRNGEGTVLAIAVDDFKLFNQTYGQKNGDLLLCKIADCLIHLSPNRTCYRYGGDIFAIILKKADKKESLQLADTIKAQFAESFYIGNVGYSVSVTIGIVEYPQHSEDENYSIITALDFSIYQAKKRGKGEIAFLNEKLVKEFKRKHEIAHALTEALYNQSFKVYIQPIYHTKQKKFAFGEALLRLHDEKLGWISPAEFIPIAEETGQILEITYFVLEQVCSFLERNRDILKNEISVSVNFSVVQFMQNNMAERVNEIIKRHHIPPDLIKIEVTESVVAESFDKIKSMMQELNQLGISFALDDYGCGYSNISYLINLPFSVVKLDKSIIDNIAEDPRFITALVPMFRSLDKILIAEGVETEEQADILTGLSCDSIQGYYFAKPMPMEDAIELFNHPC